MHFGKMFYPFGCPAHAFTRFRLASAKMKDTTHNTSETHSIESTGPTCDDKPAFEDNQVEKRLKCLAWRPKP